NRPAVFQLFIDVTRLTHTGKSREASAAGAHSPRRNSNAKCLRFVYEIFNFDILAAQFLREVFVVFFDPRSGLLVLLSNERIIDPEIRHDVHLINPSCKPPSTGMT